MRIEHKKKLMCAVISQFDFTKAVPFGNPFIPMLHYKFRSPNLYESNELDHNDIHPGTKKPNKGRGIYHFGNDLQSKEELWFTNEDMRTHALIFGSTGSGKTEMLVSLAYNALLQASGFIYVDGKGDNSLYANIFSMVRYMGREDDMLLISTFYRNKGYRDFQFISDSVQYSSDGKKMNIVFYLVNEFC